MNSTSYTFKDENGDLLDLRCEGSFCDKSDDLVAAVEKIFPKANKVRESSVEETDDDESDDMPEMAMMLGGPAKKDKPKGIKNMACGSMKVRNMGCGSMKKK